MRHALPAALGKIDGFVNAEMDHFGTPGIAVSVIYDDEVLFSKGYGVREVGKTDPITQDTVFALASLSKAISATAIANLVAKEVIGWDDPIHDHGAAFSFRDPWVTDHVTFADLYSHRSGLPGLFGNTLDRVGLIGFRSGGLDRVRRHVVPCMLTRLARTLTELRGQN